MKWQDAYDIRAAKNIRCENVYDIYRKGTEHMLWADIPVDKIDEFLKDMVAISERVIQQQMDELFSDIKVDKPAENKPMEVEYDRLRQYSTHVYEVGDDEQ